MSDINMTIFPTGLSYSRNTKAPIETYRVFNTLVEAQEYVNDVDQTAYKGLTISIVNDNDNNGLYLVKQAAGQDSATTGILEKIGTASAEDVAAKADKTTTISAGEGLTGGGSLEANRTIAHTVPTGAAVKAEGLYKVATDKFGHVTSAVTVSKGDITALGIPAQDTNTTYTFAGGTNKLTVTPSGGTAQDIEITPSISNNVVKTPAPTSSGWIPKFNNTSGTIENGYSVQTLLTADNGGLPTSAAVLAAIDSKIAAADAMIFKGTLGVGGDITALPGSNYKVGWTYKVISAGVYAGKDCEIGDMVIAISDAPTHSGGEIGRAVPSDEDWTVVQTNIDGAVTGPTSATNDHVATFDGATGKVVKDSGKTLGVSVPANAVFTDTKVTAVGNHYTPSGGTAAPETAGSAISAGGKVITGVTKDAAGHVTGVTTGTIPAAQTLASLGGIGAVTFSSDTLTVSATKTDTSVSLSAELYWEQF